MRKRGRSRAAPRVRGRMQMRKPMSANEAGRLAWVVVSGAIGAVLIVTLGAAAALAAGPRAGAGTVTDYQFALRGVSVLSASDAWAVGDGATVLHWDGTSWAPVTIPNLPVGAFLSAVDALSRSDVWAAGYGFAQGGPETTLIVHWNGTAWTRVPSPGSFSYPLFPEVDGLSMDSASDGWVVGRVQNNKTGISKPLTLHWNGTSWARVTSSAASFFNGVVSVSPTDATAVGADRAGGVPAAFHWNGSTWTLAAALPPPPGVPASDLAGPYGLSASSATNMWTVGGHITSTAGVTNLAWHWNGTRWTVGSMPLVTDLGSGVIAEAAITPANVWAVGWRNTTNAQATVSAHWNGTNWTRVATPSPGGTDETSALLGVAAAGTQNIWAVGYYNTLVGIDKVPHTLILRWNGTRWIRS